MTDLDKLIEAVKSGVKYETMGHTMMCQKALPKPDDFDGSREAYAKSDAQMAILAWRNGDLNAAKALHETLLPGWGWRVCECHLSDDAAVFPDFNSPEHGELLKRELDQGVDWFGLTDVDQRPAGNPARAWLLAILKAYRATKGDRMTDKPNILRIGDRAGASPEAIAHAVAASLVREHGGEKASALADQIVKAVQEMRRKATKRDNI